MSAPGSPGPPAYGSPLGQGTGGANTINWRAPNDVFSSQGYPPLIPPVSVHPFTMSNPMSMEHGGHLPAKQLAHYHRRKTHQHAHHTTRRR